MKMLFQGQPLFSSATCVAFGLSLLSAVNAQNHTQPNHPPAANPGPGGSDPGATPLLSTASAVAPAASPVAITNHGGYVLTGASNIYAIYYGASNFFNSESGQAGCSDNSMNGISLTAAIDEFLTYFPTSASTQWTRTMSDYSIGTLSFQKSVRIDDSSAHYLGLSSFYGYNVVDYWLGAGGSSAYSNTVPGVIKSKLLPNDPFDGIYVIIIAEGESLRSTSGSGSSYIISSKGETQLDGSYADCSVHSFSYVDPGLGTGKNSYLWAMVGVPQSGVTSNNCYTRNSNALGLTTSSFIKRNAVMSGIAHEVIIVL